MTLTRTQRIAILGGSALVAASAIYLLASGARPGGPLVFAVLAAASLFVTLWLLLRTAASLLFEPAADEVQAVSGRRRKELEREKQILLKALKELEFDYEMKKISDADKQEMTALYRSRAMRVMRLLDEGDVDYRKQVERDVHARVEGRADAGGQKDPAPEAS